MYGSVVADRHKGETLCDRTSFAFRHITMPFFMCRHLFCDNLVEAPVNFTPQMLHGHVRNVCLSSGSGVLGGMISSKALFLPLLLLLLLLFWRPMLDRGCAEVFPASLSGLFCAAATVVFGLVGSGNVLWYCAFPLYCALLFPLRCFVNLLSGCAIWKPSRCPSNAVGNALGEPIKCAASTSFGCCGGFLVFFWSKV